MNDNQKRAAIRQLEEKLTRQQEAAEATRAMLELLRSQPIDKDTPKR